MTKRDTKKLELLTDMEDDMKYLKELVKDERCLDVLSQKLDEFNVFDVLKSAHRELKHSNVLAWLLDPHGSHLMGRRFFDAFVRTIAESSVASNFLVKAYVDYNANIQVSTEVMNIDLLVVVEDAKLVIAIENKIWSKVHDQQLSRYHEILESTYKRGWNKFYFYLTPNGDVPTDDSKHWSAISYQDIYDAIQEIMPDIAETNQAKPFIQQYCKVIERESMGQSEVEDLCYAIYRRHAHALNQIFSTVGCDGSPLRTLLESVLKKLEEEKKILFCKDKGHYAKPAFHTVKMDDFLGKKAAGRNGSWGNDYLYVFLFDRRDSKKVTLRFEVGPYQATEDELCKINAMVRAVTGSSNTKGKDKTSEDQYCRIWQCKTTFNTERKDFSADGLEEWVRKSIEDLFQQESTWIDKAKKELEENHVDAKSIE